MKDRDPRNLNRRHLQRLLSEAHALSSTGGRMDCISRKLLGCPYEANPLIGSAEMPEAYTVSLESFDCVTYMETVLALAASRTVVEFIGRLRRIRYEAGQPKWSRRNHYMTVWIRNNTRSGVVRPVPLPVSRVVKDRRLDAVPGLPPVQIKFTCIPKSCLPGLKRSFRTGDLIFFVSTRKDLDVFHCGILIVGDGRLLLRHASRSRNAVIEQDLTEFLKGNRMSGVMIVRPGGDQRP